MNRLPDAISLTLLEYPWAPKDHWKVFPKGKLAPTDPPPTAETCLQAVRLLTSQVTAYSDETRDSGPGVIVTCGDPANSTNLARRSLRRLRLEAAVMQLALEWVIASHPDHSLTISTDSQVLLKAVKCRSPATSYLRSILNARPGPTTILRVPSHKGMHSYELAGTEAKKVAATTSNPSPTHPRDSSSIEHSQIHHQVSWFKDSKVLGSRTDTVLLACLQADHTPLLQAYANLFYPSADPLWPHRQSNTGSIRPGKSSLEALLHHTRLKDGLEIH